MSLEELRLSLRRKFGRDGEPEQEQEPASGATQAEEEESFF